ncbi:hypothetical protein [Candidatus Nitrosacidococcus sp. I8]|uniref:COG4315 family predicted lipoprotein n=1 Tax=Candidatus Nitrosacidococcus sp. I8 TaxID=2942908 RepID=UPI0022277292|nr:hypothetical protein [Candidatus Nitrosacidococcus sp. I8]CAH9016788.1 hypothetical protein NURINAE_00246 [Candidatus Nitrosacidococcus sp. I8]
MKNSVTYSAQGAIALILFLSWGSAQALSTAEKSPYGTYLTDINGGNSLYISQSDEQGKASHCYRRCNKVWRPVINSGSNDQINSSFLGLNNYFLSNIQYGKDGGMHIAYDHNALPKADKKVNKFLLGTIIRADGLIQITYNGWPLYYYLNDFGPNDTHGQGRISLGSKWALVTPEGKAIDTPITVSSRY